MHVRSAAVTRLSRNARGGWSTFAYMADAPGSIELQDRDVRKVESSLECPCVPMLPGSCSIHGVWHATVATSAHDPEQQLAACHTTRRPCKYSASQAFEGVKLVFTRWSLLGRTESDIDWKGKPAWRTRRDAREHNLTLGKPSLLRGA